ncbi:MAG TPA: TPM domain-containing protein [Nitrospiria bacterium]|nr:TPM domain-containing protein [Nitrospiria bacterium]
MVAYAARVFRHLLNPPWRVRTAFPQRTMRMIEQAIRESEATHNGQIRFAVEAALDIGPLLRNQSARERAIDVFSFLRVWDTEHNNGVLVYLLLADRDVEIVADRGIARHVAGREWERICRDMEAAFREGRFEDGVIEGVRAVSAHLARHHPGTGGRPNELPDVPVVL